MVTRVSKVKGLFQCHSTSKPGTLSDITCTVIRLSMNRRVWTRDNNRRSISKGQSSGDVEIGTNQQSKVTQHKGLPKAKLLI